MRNTLRALVFFASLHLTIFEQAANFEFFNSQVKAGLTAENSNRSRASGLRPIFVGAGSSI
jgi:hypothetical protein